MLTIWVKILLVALGVVFGFAAIAGSWVVFTAFYAIYQRLKGDGE